MAKVVSLGIHIADVLGRPVTNIPEGQNLALLEEIRLTVAGTAAGTSVDLAKLGLDVYAIGAIGQDELGDFVVYTMKRYGIHTDGLVRKKGVQTSATMLPIRPNGERPALHVPGANAHFSLEDVNFDLIAAADYLHIGGTPLMPRFDGEPMRKVFEFARQHKVVTTYDLLAINKPNLLEQVEMVLPFVDYFMPGFEEAVMMCGLRDRHEAIRFFLERGAGHTVFKMGNKGSSAAWLEDGMLKEIIVPAMKVPVVDSTGCGDAYCAGFISGLSLGYDLQKACRLGTAAGGLVIQGLGSDAGIVDLKSTLRFMEEQA
ncbi:MAG: carbohydrate kinase [Spirochaetes bacterium RBG_16_67_19]|nr:MAG: carbohydrate kinase [Spirochaetes bacterium RBG_16_67_19]